MSGSVEIMLTDTIRLALGKTSATLVGSNYVSQSARKTAEYLTLALWKESITIDPDGKEDIIEICEWGRENMPEQVGELAEFQETVERMVPEPDE